LTSADEERIINRITDEVMKRELETVAIIFLESVKPISFVGSQMGMAFVAPFLIIFGDLGIDYIKFFEKRENVEKLLKRLEEEIKIKDEDKQKAKELKKQISNTFGFQIDILPGFSLQDTIQNERLIGFARKDSWGHFAISFTSIDSPPSEILNEISTNLNDENVRLALMLSQDMILSRIESKNLRIKGHKAYMAAYKWINNQSEGMLESYGFWCDKARKLFILTMRTGPLTGKKDKERIQNLRYQLGSMKCH
jgi:hypothetical protein